jgi:hypothetical protein
MNAKLSLVAATAVAALAAGVPVAFGGGQVGGASDPVRDRGFESVAGAKVEPAAVAYFRANELATAAASDPIADASTSNGRGIGIAWAQIGIAFGVGFLLAVGLVVAMRMRPSPPLAQ